MIKVWDQTQMLNQVARLFLCLRNTLVIKQYTVLCCDQQIVLNVWFALKIN